MPTDAPMPALRRGDVVKVAFPFGDTATRERRPALVVSDGDLASEHGLIWVAMITSAENEPWPTDIAIEDHSTAGLPAPSVVRCAKIATLDARDAKRIGRVVGRISNEVAKRLANRIGAQ